MEVIKLTESLLRKIIIQEISDQLKTNAMIGAAKKARTYREKGDEGMAQRKERQSDAFAINLNNNLNPQKGNVKRAVLYQDDETFVEIGINPYEYLSKKGSKIFGYIHIQTYHGGKYEGWYNIEYDEDMHQITKEEEYGDIDGTLRRVTNQALNAYNQGKKKIRSLVLGYANREGGAVGQYYVDNATGRYSKIGDAMRASADLQKQHASIYGGDKGSSLYGVKKVQPLKEDAKCSMEFINGCFYSVNGTKCLYDDGLFFWKSEDGTKWFRAETLKNSNAKIEAINN